MSVDRYCINCGRSRGLEDQFCGGCGKSFPAPGPAAFTPSTTAATAATNGRLVLASNVVLPEAPSWAPRAATRERDWMHPGLAFALASVTFGLYTYYWLFNTWRQIKRFDGDRGKSPLGHALATLVPIYGLFRLHAHMRTIVELVQSTGGQTTLSPGVCVVLWIVINVLVRASDLPQLEWVFLLAVLVASVVVAWGQAALNQAWTLHDPQAPVRPTHPLNWVVVGIGAIVTALVIYGLAP